jgi:putative FmdB family regulatory protein
VPVPEDFVPTYQYACKDCGHRFEAVQSFSDTSLTECPQCAGGLRKVFASVGIVFKGSGFYRTDSRSGAGAVGATANGASSDSGSSAASSSSDAKSASSGTSSGSASSTPATSSAS